MVREALASPVPAPRKTPVRQSPVLDAVAGLIEAMLREDLNAPRKQRHTSRRIWQRLAGGFLAAVDVAWQRARRTKMLDFVMWLRTSPNPARDRRRVDAPAPGSVTGRTGKPYLRTGYAPATINHAVSVLAAFYGYHLETGQGPVVSPVPPQSRDGRRLNAHHNPLAAGNRASGGAAGRARGRPAGRARAPRRGPAHRGDPAGTLAAARGNDRRPGLAGRLPGETWQENWLLSGSDARGQAWGPGLTPRWRNRITTGLGVLIVLRAVRPAYGCPAAGCSASMRSSGGTTRPPRSLTWPAGASARAEHEAEALNVLTRMVIVTGRNLTDLGVADVLDYAAARRQIGRTVAALPFSYELLRSIGAVSDGPPTLAQARGQLTVAELVDRYPVACRAVRDILVHYLAAATPGKRAGTWLATTKFTPEARAQAAVMLSDAAPRGR